MKTIDFISRLFAVSVVILCLWACQADQEEINIPGDSQFEELAADNKREASVKNQSTIEEQKIQPHVDLKVSDEVLQRIDAKEQSYLLDPPPQIGEKIAQKRKVKISGGVLLDADKERMVDKVDGGKMNISIPLN